MGWDVSSLTFSSQKANEWCLFCLRSYICPVPESFLFESLVDMTETAAKFWLDADSARAELSKVSDGSMALRILLLLSPKI